MDTPDMSNATFDGDRPASENEGWNGDRYIPDPRPPAQCDEDERNTPNCTHGLPSTLCAVCISKRKEREYEEMLIALDPRTPAQRDEDERNEDYEDTIRDLLVGLHPA